MKPIIRKLGKVSITPQGDYDVGIDYKILDTINDNGKTFIAKKNVPKGTPTDNEEYWMEIASGKNATIQNVTATVDNHIGTPEVIVTLTGDEFNRIINLEFKNLKGDTGASINIISNLTGEDKLPNTGKYGDAYLINGNLYLYVEKNGNVVSNPKWNNSGTIKFNYEDFTPEQIEDLKKPAYDAANEIQTDYNNNLKPAVIEAINNTNATITEANKQSTYAKEQGDYAKREADRISTLDLNIYRVVSDLPSIPSMTDEDKNKIYLKISVKQGETNKYDEYLVVNDAWELLGQYEAAIDLTKYVGKKELSSEIAELPTLEDISKFVCINENGKVAGVMTKEQVASVLAELIGIATSKKSGLHPAAKFSQSNNVSVSNIDNITILSTDIYNGNILENNATFIVKTYPASPAYMYQEAFSMYPIRRYWRAKVDGTWREWNEL